MELGKPSPWASKATLGQSEQLTNARVSLWRHAHPVVEQRSRRHVERYEQGQFPNDAIPFPYLLVPSGLSSLRCIPLSNRFVPFLLCAVARRSRRPRLERRSSAAAAPTLPRFDR